MAVVFHNSADVFWACQCYKLRSMTDLEATELFTNDSGTMAAQAMHISIAAGGDFDERLQESEEAEAGGQDGPDRMTVVDPIDSIPHSTTLFKTVCWPAGRVSSPAHVDNHERRNGAS